MIKINYPESNILTRQRGGLTEIFDAIRKKWLLLTPEEWVRQNMVQYLLISKKYPAALIAAEKEVRLGELRKRCDLVIYNRDLLPWMIIECKEMKVALTPKVLEQVLRYHISLPATYLVITNGSYTIGYVKEENKFSEITEFPEFI